MILVARIGDKVSGEIINITVKDAANHVLAPTWNMVSGFKSGDLSWKAYTLLYKQLLQNRLTNRPKEFYNIIEMAKTRDIVLVCYCTDESRCHRTLAKEFLESL